MNRGELVNKIILKIPNTTNSLIMLAVLETKDLKQMYYELYNIA